MRCVRKAMALLLAAVLLWNGSLPGAGAEEIPETLPEETVAETLSEETVPQETEPLLINGKPLEFYQVNRYEFQDSVTGEPTTAKYVYLTLPEMTVEVYVDRNNMENAQVYSLLRLMREYRGYLLPVIGICLLELCFQIIKIVLHFSDCCFESRICCFDLGHMLFTQTAGSFGI